MAHVRGRGAGVNPANRFETLHLEVLDEEHERVARSNPNGVQLPTTVRRDETRSVINRVDSPDLNFRWTINPYRGCEFGCTYCYARYTHGFFGLARWQDFERKIYFKRGAAASLRRGLRRARLEGQPISIGTVTDPYQPAERRYGVTRSLLETFDEVSGLDISITTRSPLILRDLDLFIRLDRKHSITVNVTVTTLDARTARRIEPRSPDPQARMRVIDRFAAEGITTIVRLRRPA